jgi:putative glycosyltransferase (TIGR04372 family)
MLKFQDGYIEHNEMHELIYSSFKVDRNNPLLQDIYNRSDLLAEIGFSNEDWFVALHIRNTGYRYDERQVDQFKFNQALEFIISAGGKIVQFGQNMTKVQLSDQTKIRHITELESARGLDISVIAKSRFLLTTSSGPIGIAHVLGVPVLQTDSPAICLHAKTASVGTRYLPKKLIKGNRIINYSELAETGLGYTHISLNEWRKLGIKLVENSAKEISEATLEMLNPKKSDSLLDQKLHSLQKDLNVVARGKFSNSYLVKNNWMLN